MSAVGPGQFDAVLFDAGGVLVLPDPTVLAPLLEPLGGAPEVGVHRRAHYAGMAAKSAAGSGEADWNAYNETYVVSVGVPHEHTEHAAHLLNRTRSALLWRWPIPESIAALWMLAGAGVPMGVVSNAAGQIEEVLGRTGVCQVGEGRGVAMRVIVDSSVVGVAKPDPAIFEHALPFFDGVERERIAYVGDSVTMDVGAATAAGLTPILLDPHDDHPGLEFAGCAVTRIAGLAELLQWFA